MYSFFSSPLTIELMQSCTKPSRYTVWQTKFNACVTKLQNSICHIYSFLDWNNHLNSFLKETNFAYATYWYTLVFQINYFREEKKTVNLWQNYLFQINFFIKEITSEFTVKMICFTWILFMKKKITSESVLMKTRAMHDLASYGLYTAVS